MTEETEEKGICTACAAEVKTYFLVGGLCPTCAKSRAAAEPEEKPPLAALDSLRNPSFGSSAEHTTGTPQMLGLIGGGLLIAGAFCPFISAPIIGDVTFIKDGTGDGLGFLLLGGLAIICCALGKCRLAWLEGGAALIILAFDVRDYQTRMAQAAMDISDELKGNLFGGLAQMMLQSIHLQWGVGVVAAGGILLIAAAAMSRQS